MLIFFAASSNFLSLIDCLKKFFFSNSLLSLFVSTPPCSFRLIFDASDNALKYFLSLAKAQVNVTKLNDAPIAGSEKYELKNQDKIDFALGRLVVVFEVDEPDLDKKDKVSDEKETGKSSKEKDNDDKVESSK